jgi:nucleoside-diphosphate-sugar epimerase
LKIFLTGATGNMGIPVLQELIKQNYQVTCLVRKPIDLNDCETIVGDLNKIHRFASEISESDGIIHLASPRTLEREIAVNEDILGTGSLLDNWQNGNFIYTSSQTVYGIPNGKLVETNLLDPDSWYDISKVVNEFQIKKAAHLKNRMAGIALRPSLLFGYGARSLDRQFLPYVFSHCMNGSKFIFDTEEGLETYGSSYLGEKDCAQAIVSSLKISNSGSYNLASGYCTWKELLESIAKYTKTSLNIMIKPGAQPEKGECRLPQSRSLMDTSKFITHSQLKNEDKLDDLVCSFIKSTMNS